MKTKTSTPRRGEQDEVDLAEPAPQIRKILSNHAIPPARSEPRCASRDSIRSSNMGKSDGYDKKAPW